MPSSSRSRQLPRLRQFPRQRAESTLTTISHAKDLESPPELMRDKKIKDTGVRDGEIYVKNNDDSINKLSTSCQLDVFG